MSRRRDDQVSFNAKAHRLVKWLGQLTNDPRDPHYELHQELREELQRQLDAVAWNRTAKDIARWSYVRGEVEKGEKLVEDLIGGAFVSAAKRMKEDGHPAHATRSSIRKSYQRVERCRREHGHFPEVYDIIGLHACPDGHYGKIVYEACGDGWVWHCGRCSYCPPLFAGIGGGSPPVISAAKTRP